jgi:hypothetical protein
MIDARCSLRDIRARLRHDVAPRLDDDRHLQSEVVAMVGILDNVLLEVMTDEGWCRQVVDDVLGAVDAWLAVLPAGAADDVEPLLASARDERSAAAARDAALAVAQTVARRLWRTGMETPEAERVLRSLRSVVAADLRRQLERRR